MSPVKNSRCVKTAVILVICIFIWIQLHISVDEQQNIIVDYYDTTLAYSNPMDSSTAMTDDKTYNLHLLKQLVDEANQRQLIHNQDQYGDLEPNDVIIVVQVHDRIQYLIQLINSLQNATDIARTLIVFSHDLFDNEINLLIEDIEFAKVMQIFYPKSLQLHPSEFPGQSADDCPRNINKSRAKVIGCRNADSPDMFGHYREAKFTQTKHHWWWKANRVFDGLRVTRNHTGPVLFLEEDHYVAPDFLFVLDKMQEISRQPSCQNCSILCLGSYDKRINFRARSNSLELHNWVSNKHNMGMAFNRSIWENLKACSQFFCRFDEYNWDWTLQHLSNKCLKHRLVSLVAKAPRVFHMGECTGMHHTKNNCNPQTRLSQVQIYVQEAWPNLYPMKFYVSSQTHLKSKFNMGNGGWGDRRDHQLCLEHSNLTRNDGRS